MTDPKNVALEWARRGKPVFPCDPQNKKPRTKHGFKDATIGEDQIESWWETYPDSMVGIPTGIETGLLVLDFDLDENKGIDAMPHLDSLIGTGDIPVETYRVRTPRGGWHVYLEMPEVDIRSRAGVHGVRGFDIRGNGGYVIAGGSRRFDGGEYRAEDPATRIRPAPASLVEGLQQPRHEQDAISTSRTDPNEPILEGTRNEQLFREARSLAKAGFRGKTLLSAISGINSMLCQPPLPEHEVETMVARVSENAGEVCTAPTLEPVLIGELDPGDTGQPVWEGFLANGTTTLLSAREKAGKTTLLGLLLRETGKSDGGELLGYPVHPVRTLLISEESAGQWAARRDDDGLPEDLLVVTRRHAPPGDLAAWEQMCEQIIGIARLEDIGLVVLDTWAHWNPTESENDNAQIARAARSIGRIAEEAGVAILLVHHMSKAGGSRGGTALPAAVDTVIEMKRPSSRGIVGEDGADDEGDDGTRVFTITGRLESPPTIIASWDGNTYRVNDARTVKHLKGDRRRRLIIDTLSRLGEGNAGEIRTNWPEGGMQPPSERTLMRDLKRAVESGEIEVARGTGGATDPRVYRIVKSAGVIPA